VGFRNSAIGPDLGIYAALSDSLMRPEDGPALDLLLGEVSDRAVGSVRPELSTAMGAASVVVGRVVGEN
jgi:hypothetical protein